MPTILLGDAISSAMTRTSDLLFRPFNFRKWTCIALAGTFCLAGQGGMNFSMNLNPFRKPAGGPSPFPSFDAAKAYVLAHFPVILTLGLIGIVFLFALYLLARWLNSRAQFMLFDNIVRNDDRIKQPWHDHRLIGNSLFKFRILYDLVIFNILLALGAITVAIAWADIHRAILVGEYAITNPSIAAIIFAAIAFILFGLTSWLVSSVIFDMAVPVMYIRTMLAWPAIKTTWRELFLPHFWSCILFFLCMFVMKIAQGIWIFVGTFALVICTCCTIALVMFIPIIGMYPVALVSLPVLVYERAFKLHFISQFGDDYRIIWHTPTRTGFPVILTPTTQPPPPPSPSDIPRIY